jgi:hypothetical protein
MLYHHLTYLEQIAIALVSQAGVAGCTYWLLVIWNKHPDAD